MRKLGASINKTEDNVLSTSCGEKSRGYGFGTRNNTWGRAQILYLVRLMSEAHKSREPVSKKIPTSVKKTKIKVVKICNQLFGEATAVHENACNRHKTHHGMNC